MGEPRRLSDVMASGGGPRRLSDVMGERPSAPGLMLRGAINSLPQTIEGVGVMAGQPENSPIFGVSDYLSDTVAPLADAASPQGVTRGERLLEEIGEQAVPALAGMGVAGAMGGPIAAMGEGALALSTPAVGEAVEVAGGSPRVATAAEIVYGMLAPSVATRAVHAAGGAAPRMHQLAADRAVRRTLTPPDEAGAGRWHEAAADAIEAAPEGVTADMVLGEIAPNFEGLALRKSDPAFQGRMAARKNAIGFDQAAQMEGAIGTSSMEPFSGLRETFEARELSVGKQASALFDGLDEAGTPPASPDRLHRAIEEIAEESTQGTARHRPTRTIRTIESFEGDIPWRELQGIRQDVSEQMAIASRNGQKTRARWLGKLRDAIDETFTDPNSPHAESHPEAVAAWREYRSTFDTKSKAYRAFAEQSDPRRFVAEIMDGRNAPAEIARAAKMLDGDPIALNDFRVMVARDTLQPEVGGTSPKQIRSRYQKRRTAMAKLWTPEEIRIFDEVVASNIDTSVGKAGRRAMNLGTNSANLDLPSGRGGAFSAVARFLKSQAFGNDLLKNRVLDEYLLNPKQMVPVLRAWQQNDHAAMGRLVLEESLRVVARSALNQAPQVAQDGTTP